ncbi:MAG: hypothetical protein K2W95_18440 [Candidatus Obscuribacterales bacterium]|nr:hypothetical protein [Candidatus Obscuribacterales bacterium]
MTHCARCEFTILFGGIKVEGDTFCSERCRRKGKRLRAIKSSTAVPVKVKTYTGSQEIATQMFQEDAAKMSASGYSTVAITVTYTLTRTDPVDE